MTTALPGEWVGGLGVGRHRAIHPTARPRSEALSFRCERILGATLADAKRLTLPAGAGMARRVVLASRQPGSPRARPEAALDARKCRPAEHLARRATLATPPHATVSKSKLLGLAEDED
ncbi:MAG: hypothetical protein KIT72_02500 [Polyangiaceae bacterium]|nr:hypothetical protein [Polyangiaceae bacterium]MCW5789269.1 hypothetical protein [Polyangiaceae bacterium]